MRRSFQLKSIWYPRARTANKRTRYKLKKLTILIPVRHSAHGFFRKLLFVNTITFNTQPTLPNVIKNGPPNRYRFRSIESSVVIADI